MPEKKFFAAILDNLYEGVYFVDRERIITYWNKAAEKITGYTAEEVLGKSCADNILTHVDIEDNNLCQGMCPLAATITDRKPRQAELFLHHKDGHRVPVSVRATPLIGAGGKVIGAIEFFSDISNQAVSRMRIRELEKLALLDDLTRLGNRKFIAREIHNRFEEKRRYDIPFGILFMDIDHFKSVNDNYGHQAGDQVLRYVANTFLANSRPFDLYGRWGGEEFVGVINNVRKRELGRIGDRMRALVDQAYLVNGSEQVRVTLSVGATPARDHDTPESLLQRADRLLYESKRDGRNRITIG